MTDMTPSVELVLAERVRQIEEEGHTPQDDATYNTPQRLANAAACYAVGEQIIASPRGGSGVLKPVWPEPWRWNPQGQIRNLVKAGALILAALDLARAGGTRADTKGFDPLDYIKTKEDLKNYVEAVIEDQIEQGKLVRPQ